MSDQTPSKRLLLIVEDENSLRNVLATRLMSEGFHVITATNGKEGLNLALQELPDLILLDILMPEMGGLSMLKELRKHPEGKRMPVIILSNLQDQQDVNQALQLGARDYLIKADMTMDAILKEVRARLDPN